MSTAQTIGGALVVCALFLVWKYRRSSLGRNPHPNLPSPPTIPLLGHLWFVASKADHMYHSNLWCAETYAASSWMIDILGFPCTINSVSPDNLHHVLKGNFGNYVKGPFVHDKFEPLLGEGIFNVDGDVWLKQRKVASHIFTTNKFQMYITNVFLETIGRLSDVLDKAAESKQQVCLSDLFYRFTFDSFCKIAFGVDFNAVGSEDAPFLKTFDAVQIILTHRFENPLWKVEETLHKLWTRSDPLKENMAIVDKVIYGIIEDRRRDPKWEEKDDLLSLFLDTEFADSDKALHDVVLNFLLAGRDTTASALCWTFHKLMGDPNVLHRLRQEVQDFDLSAGPQRVYQTHKDLDYSHAVFNEVMRLYPPVPINIKTSINDDVLPDGTRLQGGMLFAWSTWSMGRLERIWGPDAKTFSPERWLTMSEKPSPYKWPAFHAGPRSCLGQRMATLEAILCTAALVARFEFNSTVDETKERDYGRSVTLTLKEPMNVTVSRL
jgi:cytochrome P450